MTGLITISAVAVIAILYVIYKKTIGKPTEEVEEIPIPVEFPVSSDENTIIFYGESNPSQSSCVKALENPLKKRKYMTNVENLKLGNVLFNDIGLTEPTYGGRKWIALTDSENIVHVVRIGNTGKILEIGNC